MLTKPNTSQWTFAKFATGSEVAKPMLPSRFTRDMFAVYRHSIMARVGGALDHTMFYENAVRGVVLALKEKAGSQGTLSLFLRTCTCFTVQCAAC